MSPTKYPEAAALQTKTPLSPQAKSDFWAARQLSFLRAKLSGKFKGGGGEFPTAGVATARAAGRSAGNSKLVELRHISNGATPTAKCGKLKGGPRGVRRWLRRGGAVKGCEAEGSLTASKPKEPEGFSEAEGRPRDFKTEGARGFFGSRRKAKGF